MSLMAWSLLAGTSVIILLCRQKVPGIFFFFVTPETAMPLAGAGADSERDEAKRATGNEIDRKTGR